MHRQYEDDGIVVLHLKAKNKAIFEDRHHFKVSDILNASHKQLMRSLKDTADKFAYQGFDPLKIANSVSALAEEGKRDLEEDLFQLIILFYCRGANAQRLRDPALSKISDEDTQRTVTTLLTTYNVQSKPGRSSPSSRSRGSH